jgi:hypothetical protein
LGPTSLSYITPTPYSLLPTPYSLLPVATSHQVSVQSADGCTLLLLQGREKDAIVISTVRSGARSGFHDDPRRACVALTRARQVRQWPTWASPYTRPYGLQKVLPACAGATPRI